MPAEKFLNGPQSALTGALTAVATSVPVVDGSLFAAGDGFQWRAVLADETVEPVVLERVLVTGRSGNTLTATRGQEGTTAVAFPTGATVVSVLTAGALDDVFATKVTNPLTAKGDLLVGLGVTNYALTGQGASVLSSAGFANAGNAMDGSDATEAVDGNLFGATALTLDLGAPRAVATFRLRYHFARVSGSSTSNWQLESSPDNTTYTVRASGSRSTAAGTEDLTQAPAGGPVTARYWRLVAPTGQDSLTEWHVQTLELRGAGTPGDPTRLPVGTTGQVLTADAAQPNGARWAALPATGLATDPLADAKGDVFAASGADAVGRLPAGTNGQVLTADSAQTLGVKWAAAAGGGAVATDPLWDAKGDLAVATGADAAARVAVGADNQVLTADSAQTAGVKWAPVGGTSAQDIGLEFVFDGAGQALTTVMEGLLQVPFAGTITSVTLLGDQAGSCVVQLRKATYAGYPTLTSIYGAAPPTLVAAQKSTDAVLTGWTTALAAGDVLSFRFASVSTLTRLTVSLGVQRAAAAAVGAGTLKVYDAGALVAERPGLNVVGATVADDAANSRVTVTVTKVSVQSSAPSSPAVGDLWVW